MDSVEYHLRVCNGYGSSRTFAKSESAGRLRRILGGERDGFGQAHGERGCGIVSGDIAVKVGLDLSESEELRDARRVSNTAEGGAQAQDGDSIGTPPVGCVESS